MSAKQVFILILCFLFGSSLLKAQTKCEIPFWREGAHMLVSVKLHNDKNYTFLFDTGASSNIISTELANTIGLKLGKASRVQSFGGSQTAYSTVVRKLVFDGASFENQNFMSLKNVGASRKNYVGVIGSSFLRDKILKIDNEKEILTIYEKSFEPLNKGVKLPIVMKGGLPGIDLELYPCNRDMIKVRMILDTGADAALIFFPHSEREYNLAESFKKSIVNTVNSPGGFFTTTIARLPEVNLGELKLNKIPIKVMSMEGKLPPANPFYKGIIGNKVLEKFNIVLNIPQQYIILEPRENMGDEIIVDPSGFTFMTNYKREFVIAEVTNRGAAKKAGLVSGDIIEKINNMPSSEYSLPEFMSLIRNVGTVTKFTVRRNGKIKKLKYIAKDAI